MLERAAGKRTTLKLRRNLKKSRLCCVGFYPVEFPILCTRRRSFARIPIHPISRENRPFCIGTLRFGLFVFNVSWVVAQAKLLAKLSPGRHDRWTPPERGSFASEYSLYNEGQCADLAPASFLTEGSQVETCRDGKVKQNPDPPKSDAGLGGQSQRDAVD